MTVADEVIFILQTKGNDSYFGEPVSQAEHALQTAFLAGGAGAEAALIAAALLHDIGHLLHQEAEDIAASGVDARHEELGEAWLAQHFPPTVCEPVKLHVAAKRYLCATDPDYFAQLSPASIESLELQGGPMSAAEVASFQANPFYEDAICLRRWDDRAKIQGLAVPDAASYRELLTAVAAKEILG